MSNDGRSGVVTRIMALLALAGMSCAPAAYAEDAGEPPGGWQFEFTPYLWMTGMTGDVQAGRLPKTEMDMSFSDILDVLDFGLMGAFEARKDRWGILLDAQYMKVSDSATARRTGPGPIGATLTAKASVEAEQTLLAVAVAYRLLDESTALDVIGGARYLKMDVEADIEGSLFGQSGEVQRSGDKDWVDPYIGLRVQRPLSEKWAFTGYGDVGGFGVGSDFTWQVAVGLDYAFSKSVTGKFGYRYLNIDYDKHDFLYDMENSGLYVGAGFRF